MEPTSIPKQYGGELDWQWGDMPNLDEPAREKLQGVEQAPAEDKTKKELMKGPMLFKGDKIEVLGTESGKERRETILVPNSEQTISTEGSNGKTGDVASNPALENEKTGIDAVNVDQVSGQTQTTAA